MSMSYNGRHVDSKTRAERIQAFCERLGKISEECSSQVARFFAEQYN